MWKPRIKKTKDDLYTEINQILIKSGLSDGENFYGLNHTEVVTIVYEYCKILEFKLYFKSFKTLGVPLRQLYTCCEKLSMLEKKEILEFRKTIPTKKKDDK